MEKKVPFIQIIVIERTYEFFGAFFIVRTWLHFKDQGMVIQFFPSMALITVNLLRTSFTIIVKENVSLPVFTYLRCVIVNVRHPSEILPIMSIRALFFIMFDLVVGTGNCFEIKNIEISIPHHIMQEIYLNLFFIMGKWTEIAITAFREMGRVIFAKFGLVILPLIELLHLVMCHEAFISARALVVLLDIRTYLIWIEISGSFSVLLVVIEWTLLMVVLKFDATFVQFKIF